MAMRAAPFSDEDLKAIATDRYHHPHPHVQRKMEVLWLKSHALPHQQIADLAGVSVRTVQRYLADYRVVFEEAPRRERLVRTLEVFAKAGWPEAMRLLYELPDLLR